MHAEPPFIEVVEKRVGQLKIDSTPAGAEAIVDGKSYGRTPVTIPDLEVGTHTLVLKSAAGEHHDESHDQGNQTTRADRGDLLGLAGDLLADSGRGRRSTDGRSTSPTTGG